MFSHSNHRSVLPNTSAMADIAFLLLVFFMVTTEMKEEKGLTLKLPPFQSDKILQRIHQRNLFKVQINSLDEIMVNSNRRTDFTGIHDEIKDFIFNNGKNKYLSDSPEAAIVTLQSDRGTSHKTFITALDAIQEVYYSIYAERANMSVTKYRSLDLSDPDEKKIYIKAREGIPMNISIAEPTKTE